MRAYRNFKFIEGPDCVDLVAQARKASAGHLPGKNGVDRHNHDRHSNSKRQIRRILKRRDRAITDRLLRKDME